MFRNVLAGCAVIVMGRCLSAQALTLVDSGRAKATIYVRAGAADEVKDAAADLARVVKIMSGAEPAVLEVANADAVPAGPAILLEALAEQAGLEMNKTSRAKDGFRYAVQRGRLLIVAESPRGIYLGTSRFLETFGCGWYVPGRIGEVIPRRATVVVPDDLDDTEVSDSIHRRFWYGGKGDRGGTPTSAWLRRINGDYRAGSWSHAYAHLVSRELFEQHPEYFALERGKRSTRQLCTTNPEVIRLAAETLIEDTAGSERLVFPAGPNDGGGLCECQRCAKLDTPGYLEPSSGKVACSDRVFKFAADVAEITSKRFPDRDLGILVYSEYSRVPVKIKQVHPNVFPMMAPIRRCRLHGPGHPGCEMNRLWQEEIRGWARVSQGKLGFYVYNYNLADSLLPFTKFECFKRMADVVHQAGITQLAWTFETIDSWAMMAPSLYLSARLSWNSRLDIDAELDRFYRGFYGAAQGPMRDYWTRIDAAYANTDTHTGSSYGQHKIWTPALRRACRADIDKAKALAANARQQEAVAMADAGLRCAELYMEIWEHMTACRFAEAARAKEALQAHVAGMDARKDEPHWAHGTYAYDRYFQRFIGRTVDAGAKALAGGGKLVVQLSDVWKFATDEEAAGVGRGWFKPDLDDGGWRDMGTYSTSWVDEGLTWYHGDAWYRVRFDLPADAGGKDLRLWFGGFDNNVDVYLNGRSLGEKTGFVEPQEYVGIAEHLNFGGSNVIAVRVSSGGLAEIGTGGIMMPVMIYRPANEQGG